MIFWVRFSAATRTASPYALARIVCPELPYRTVLSTCYHHQNLLYLNYGAGPGRGLRRGEPPWLDQPRRRRPRTDPADLHGTPARPRARARGAATRSGTARRVAHAGGASLPA